MQYRILGKNAGLRVAQLALGTGNFGTRWGSGASVDASKAILDAYIAAGGNFIDTADCYQSGEAEEMLGHLLTGRRNDLVLGTKFSMGTGVAVNPARLGNSRKSMTRSLEDSLRRLRTDHVDIFWVHLPDGATQMEEIVRGFDDLVSSGKILYCGLSNFPAWRVSRAATLAEIGRTAPIAAVQFEYSLIQRTAETEYLPMIEGLGLGAFLWSPLGGGFLSGAPSRGWQASFEQEDLRSSEALQRDANILGKVKAIAIELGCTPSQVAIAWLLHRARSISPAFIPIIGPQNADQLADYIGATTIALGDEQYRALDEASAISPGWFYTSNAAQHEGNADDPTAAVLQPPRFPVS